MDRTDTAIIRPSNEPKIAPDQGFAVIPQVLPAHLPAYPIAPPITAPITAPMIYLVSISISILF